MSKIIAQLKPFFFALVGFFAAVGLLSFAHVGPASAQSPGVNLAQLVATVNTLKSQVSTLQTSLATETTRATNAESALQTRATTLETKTAPLSVSNDPYAGGTNTLLTIKGVNVQIVDGTNSTNSSSGLGNLIIGYNGAGNDQGNGDQRTGSHNLILGDKNNYSSYGGLIAGEDNAISGPYASVSGGMENTASGYLASVSGGAENTASGPYASVSGGNSNTASGLLTSVSGGSYNTASNSYASVSGGVNVTQNNRNGWAGGSYHSP